MIFRVFDTLAKHYITGGLNLRHIVMYSDGKVENLANGSAGHELIIQFGSGIFSSDGVEIFEGDILELSNQDGRGLKTYYAVEFKNGQFFMQWSCGPTTLHYAICVTSRNVKIVGNTLTSPANLIQSLRDHEQSRWKIS